MSGSALQGSTGLTPVNAGVIPFVEIPYSYKVPGTYMEVKAAVNPNALLPFPARGLIMGQQFSTARGAQATPGMAYPIYTAQQAMTLFGAGSIAADMCVSWLKANPYTPVDCIGISDVAGGTAATGTITIGGAATSPGTLALYIAGIELQVPVNLGDTPTIVAGNIVTAISNQNINLNNPLPVSGPAHTAGVVTYTANHAGTLGNQIDVRVNANTGDMTPPGLTVTITPMSGGATDPSTQIETVLSGLTKWYTDTPFAWTDTTNIANFSAWLIANYGAMAKLDCQGYVSVSGSYGNVQTFLPNCKYISVLPVQNPMTPSWKTAAAFAAACCYSTAQAPSLQMKGVVLPDIKAPATADQFSTAEQEVLLVGGYSTYYCDANGAFYLQRVTTSYREDPGNNVQDFSWFDLNCTKVPTRVRYDWEGYISQLYPRNLLCADGTIAAAYAPNAVTPGTLKASWVGRSAVYEQNGWIQNSAKTSAVSSFTIDPNDGNRVNARQPIQIMGNLMVLAGSLEFISNN